MSPSLSRRALLVGGLTAVGSTVAAKVVSAADEKAEKTEKAAKVPGALTLESLGSMLEAMGMKATKSESRYEFQFSAKQKEEWNLSMSCVLSTDEKSIWMMAWLDELPQSAGDVPRTALLRLLSDNDKMGHGMFFAYVASNRRFVLQRVIKNEHISSASFKADLMELAATVVTTYGHWSVTGWKQLGQTQASAAGKDDDEDDGKPAQSRPASPPASKTATKEPAEPKTLKK